MRGKVEKNPLSTSTTRITPAYAGKSNVRSFSPAIRRDHPRLCGEKSLGNKNVWERQGSPPPMRGKGTGLVFNAGNIGITPAYAGKSHLWKMPASRVQDHPRLCGEKFCKVYVPLTIQGSPPPMRGKVFRFRFRQNINKDHPRLCGEKFSFSIQKNGGKGSPPPMRGKDPYQKKQKGN